jgi:pyruvate kinase
MEMAVKGDPCVVTSGYLEAVAGSTNIMKVIRCAGFEINN